MADVPFKEGKAPFYVPSRHLSCQTYYKIYGDLDSGATPLVVLHGGPGSGHEYLEPLSQLWSLYGIPVVFYDQIGCASSTHLPELDGDQTFWLPEVFLAELENLISHLRLNDNEGMGFSLLGHSFGGSLAAAYAARRPPALRKIIIASASASSEHLRQSIWGLLETLPEEHTHATEKAIEKNDFTSPAYLSAASKFYRTFVCRADPFPPKPLAANQAHQAADSTVGRTMMGQTPFLCNGSMEHWTNVPFLAEIQVPTLIYNGEFDTAQYKSMLPFFQHIAKVRWVTFPSASHMGHLDSQETLKRILKTVGDFLNPH